MIDKLTTAFREGLELPAPAVDWLRGLWVATQFLDDVADGTPIPRSDMDRAMWTLLIGLPLSEFYRAHATRLSGAVEDGLLQWKASDNAEREGNATPGSFTWRASYYNVVLTVVSICHSPQVAMECAHKVLGLYGETLEDYLKEFNHA